MIKKLYNIFLLLLLFIVHHNVEANLTISPVKLKFKAGEEVRTLIVKNSGNYISSFQLGVYSIEYVKGQEVYKATKDLLATPLMFTTMPNQSQSIRIVVLNKDIYSNQKKRYVMKITEVPILLSKQGADIKFLMQYIIPIYI